MAEKTEKPTPKRRRKAREEGNVARSAEFTGAMVMVGAGIALGVWMEQVFGRMTGLIRQSIELVSSRAASSAEVGPFLEGALWEMAAILAPVLVVGFAAAVAVNYVQIGAVFSVDPLLPKGERINPGEGFKRLFDPKKLVDLSKNVGKLSVAGLLGFLVIRDKLQVLVSLSRRDLGGALEVLAAISLELVGYLGGALVFFGVIDLVWQRHKHEKSLMMAKHEVEREHKESEGDPHIEGKRKRLHRELVEDAGLKKVEEADAVIVNPSHVAVAVRYDGEEMNAPEIVSSGRGELARQIKRIARRYGVTIVRNVDLARALVDLDIDQQIPEEFYEPVAEVLHYVYRLRDEREERREDEPR